MPTNNNKDSSFYKTNNSPMKSKKNPDKSRCSWIGMKNNKKKSNNTKLSLISIKTLKMIWWKGRAWLRISSNNSIEGLRNSKTQSTMKKYKNQDLFLQSKEPLNSQGSHHLTGQKSSNIRMQLLNWNFKLPTLRIITTIWRMFKRLGIRNTKHWDRLWLTT